MVKMDTEVLLPSLAFIILGAGGVALSLSGIAETFMEGLHAISLLALILGLILLPVGLLKGGLPTFRRKEGTTEGR